LIESTNRSARSLAGNVTPPSRTYMRVTKSGPSAMGLNDDDSSSDDEAHSVPATQPRLIPRSAVSEPFLKCMSGITMSLMKSQWVTLLSFWFREAMEHF